MKEIGGNQWSVKRANFVSKEESWKHCTLKFKWYKMARGGARKFSWECQVVSCRVLYFYCKN